MTQPKRQHWIPRCYLRAWWDQQKSSGGKPVVWRTDRHTRQSVPLTIDNVFVEGHLYTDKRPDGTKGYGLEKALSSVEGSYERVHREKLAKGRELSKADQAHLAMFAAAMLARTRQMRDHIRQSWQRAVDIAEDLQAGMAKLSPAEQKKLAHPTLGGGGPSLSLEQVREIVRQPLKHTFLPYMRAAGGALARMHMRVLIAGGAAEFITSDAPCVVFDPQAYKRPPMYRSPGLGIDTVEVTLPLSPRLMAFYCWSDQPSGQYSECPPNVVAELNRLTQFHADQYIVTNGNHTEDSWFEERALPDDAWENSAEAREAAARRRK